jgi:hypothetical protein
MNSMLLNDELSTRLNTISYQGIGTNKSFQIVCLCIGLYKDGFLNDLLAAPLLYRNCVL